jgi:hypothetical protein
MKTAVTARISTTISEAKKQVKPFLDRKILLPKGNHTNGEKFKMKGS